MFCAVRRLLTITLPRLFASQSWLEVTGNIYWSWWHIVRHKTSGRVSNAWTGPILMVRHNNVEGKYWWHCWNRNGLGPSPPLAIRTQTGRKLRENWKWHKVWSVIPAPAPHWPPIPVTMVTNCRDPNIWYKHSRPEKWSSSLVLDGHLSRNRLLLRSEDLPASVELGLPISLIYCKVHCQWSLMWCF